MGQGTAKLDTKELWNTYDADKSGFLDKNELDQLVRKVWRHYKPSTPLSDQLVERIVEELDINKDGQISKDEFDELYDELVETLAEEFGADPGAGDAAAAAAGGASALAVPGASDKECLRCPHCAFAIDPRDLERLQVDPEAIQLPGAWDRLAPGVAGGGPTGGPGAIPVGAAGGVVPSAAAVEVAGAAAVAGPLPYGTTYGGTVPPSFFMNPQGGWWAQQR